MRQSRKKTNHDLKFLKAYLARRLFKYWTTENKRPQWKAAGYWSVTY